MNKRKHLNICLDMNYHQILENIYMGIRPYAQVGKQADYIPALASVDPDQFGICINTLQGDECLLHEHPW